DNVAFGPRMKKVPPDQIKERVTKMLDLVRLETFVNRFPHQMSGGQQQRVALARALVNQPPVLLLDESLGALDVKLKKQMQLELKALQKKLGTTFIYVTHDQEEALTMGDRIALMNHGIFEQIDSPDEIYNHPKTRFAAEFLGDANFFTGATLNGNQATLPINETLLRGIVPNSLKSTSGKITLAIRPEKVRISEQAQNNTSQNSLKGVIQDRVYRGGSCLYFVTVAPEMVLKVVEQNYLSQVPFNPGQTVFISWPVEETMVLAE
ncbi:MAG: ABC transporter ATP-binding protein, partial [Planctomycetota bacterium]